MKRIIICLLLIVSVTSLQAQQAAKPVQRCQGITRAGKPCMMPVKAGEQYCYIHNPKAARCGYIKKNGEPCKILVKQAGERCRFHAGL